MENTMTTLNSLPQELKALYPFIPKSFQTSEGHRLSYLDIGQGPVVVLLHGNPTWSFYYRELAQTLSHNHRVIVPDHLGMGLSDRPQVWGYTLDGHTRNLEELLAHLSITKPSLVVHDWGGAIGMTYATRASDGIDKVVITNTAAFTSPVIPRRINILRGKTLGESLIRGLNAFALPATTMASHRGLSRSVKQGYLYPYRTWHDRIAIARFVQDIPMSSTHQSYATLKLTEQRLPTLQGKKLIVWGKKDFCFNDHFLERWKALYPEARSLEFAHAGHYVLEDAKDEAISAIAEFLSER
jgi:cis-3-alkyl-4-acyloxetan-2-one decarboxylase